MDVRNRASSNAQFEAVRRVIEVPFADAPDLSMATIDLTEVETRFVDVAKSYGGRYGISYGSRRDVGVPAAVLTRAAIFR